jgi:hypothetical protein
MMRLSASMVMRQRQVSSCRFVVDALARVAADESTVRYLGIEIDDALAIAEQVDV